MVAKEKSSYGFCPTCKEAGRMRERRINGNDICVNGHTYPSRDAIFPDEFGLMPASSGVPMPKVKPPKREDWVMNKWIIVKVRNEYMIRKEFRVDDKWEFSEDEFFFRGTVLHFPFSTHLKWFVNRRLNKLNNSEREASLYQEELKEGGDIGNG